MGAGHSPGSVDADHDQALAPPPAETIPRRRGASALFQRVQLSATRPPAQRLSVVPVSVRGWINRPGMMAGWRSGSVGHLQQHAMERLDSPLHHVACLGDSDQTGAGQKIGQAAGDLLQAGVAAPAGI